MREHNPLSATSTGLTVEKHTGTWYVIDTTAIDQDRYFLLEHEKYGDEAANVIVDAKGKLILDDVWNGFLDLYEHLENQQVFEPKSELEAAASQIDPDEVVRKLMDMESCGHTVFALPNNQLILPAEVDDFLTKAEQQYVQEQYFGAVDTVGRNTFRQEPADTKEVNMLDR